MFDGFQLLLADESIFDQLKNSLWGLVKHEYEQTGQILSRTVNVHGIRIRLKDRKQKTVKLDGSLHRYFTRGNNDTLFTYRNLVHAVHHLTEDFGFRPYQACLQRIEFGVNIEVDKPEEILDSAILFKGSPPTKQQLTHEYYYKEWEYDEYTIKLYRKGEHLIRYEIRMYRRRQLKKVDLFTLADVIDYHKFRCCLQYLEGQIQEFLFVPDDNQRITDEKLLSKWPEYRNATYWKNLKPWTKTRRKEDVLEAVAKYHLPDWAKHLSECTRQLATLMIRPDDDAIVSSLGLVGETVAGPEGAGNRFGEVAGPIGDSDCCAVDVMTITPDILIREHFVVRNTRCSSDVYIPAVSYHLLLPRGPPSRSLLL